MRITKIELSNSYMAWNNAIYNHFYPLIADDKPQFLAADDEAITSIGKTLGISEDPVGNFVQAVRKQSLLGAVYNRKFEWFAAVRESWINLDPKVFICPPYIGLLALTVLAASRMTRTKGYSSSNYYVHLRELLDVKRINEQDKDRLDSFWLGLNDFLASTRGKVSISTYSHFRHIGFPLSQIFLRRADIERFPEFFEWADLTSHQLGDNATLHRRFIDWTKLTTCHLNNHFYDFISSDFFDSDSQILLLNILRQEYRRWRARKPGETPVGGGGTVNRQRAMTLWYEDDRMGSFELRLVAEYPGEAPSEDEVAKFIPAWGAIEVDVNPNTRRIVVPVPEEKVIEILTNGVSANLCGVNYRLIPQKTWIFGPSDWAGLESTDNLSFGNKHVIIADAEVAEAVSNFFRAYAEQGWFCDPLPGGLKIFQAVRIQKKGISTPADDRLKRLVPKLQLTTRWEGGIRLSHRTWMHGFEPSLYVQAPADTMNVKLDCDVIQVIHESFTRIDLRGRGLEVGEHTLTVGPKSLQFGLDDLAEEHSFDPSCAGGYLIGRGRVVYLSRLDLHSFSDQVAVQGAQVINNRPDVVKLPPNYKEYVVLGEHPGEVFVFHKRIRTQEPFYLNVPFHPQWLITIGQKNRRRLLLVGKDCIASEKVCRKVKGLREWRYWTNRVYENMRHGHKNPNEGLWNAYCELA